MKTENRKHRATSQPVEKSAAEQLLEKIIANDPHLSAYVERRRRFPDEQTALPIGGGGLPLPQFRKKMRK